MNLSERHRANAARLIVIAVILVVYAPVAGYGFVNYDDDCYMTNSPRVQAGFTWDNVRWAFTTGYFNNWHPLTWLSHMLDFRLFGLNAGPQHAENIVFHVLNSLLLFEILRRASAAHSDSAGSVGASAFTAVLFAIHPLHVESVAWISERKDVLAAFWFLLAIWSYLAYVERPGALRYSRVLACFVLSLMSKSMLVTLPCILLLLDYWPLGRFSLSNGRSLHMRAGRLLVEKTPLFVVALLAGLVALALRTQQTTTPGGRVAQALFSYVDYMKKTIWPANLAVSYPNVGGQLPVWEPLLFLLLLATLTIAALVWSRKKPYLIVGWLWYLITLAPASGIVQIGGHGIADRYTYVPLIGLFVCAAWAAKDLADWLHVPRWALMVTACTAVIFLTGAARVQAAYWKDSETLMAHAAAVTQSNTLAHYNLGLAYLEKKEYQAAADQFLEVMKIDPVHVRAITNLGVAMASQGRLDNAKRLYYDALTLEPDDVNTLINLAAALIDEGEVEQALVHLSDALAYEPDNPDAHYNRAVALDKQGKRDEACAELATVLQLKPHHPQGEVLRRRLCGPDE